MLNLTSAPSAPPPPPFFFLVHVLLGLFLFKLSYSKRPASSLFCSVAIINPSSSAFLSFSYTERYRDTSSPFFFSPSSTPAFPLYLSHWVFFLAISTDLTRLIIADLKTFGDWITRAQCLKLVMQQVRPSRHPTRESALWYLPGYYEAALWEIRLKHIRQQMIFMLTGY